MKDRHHSRTHVPRYLLLILSLFILPCPANSEIIQQKMGRGLVATAEYLQGNPDLPAVLILHGFLQTREFITVRRLADSLHENGHTILLPNLTLGINNRQKSLSCEAIHTHSMEQDTQEISHWIDWLARKTDRNIVLVGHSVGSLQLTAYLSDHIKAPVTHAIFLSLISYGLGPVANETQADRLSAKKDQRRAPGSLRHYGLAYCKRYLTPPGAYLSYVDWDRASTLEAIGRIQSPITVILGGNDKRISSAWSQNLKKMELDVIEIEGANHFFDFQHEFDLLESIEEILNKVGS